MHATGETTEPYTTLNKTEPAGDVEWNFEKFLISKEGNVLMRFKSAVEPNSTELKTAIEKALATLPGKLNSKAQQKLLSQSIYYHC